MSNDGAPLWRAIGSALADEINGGAIPANERLPPSSVLATRFGVNRHTVLKAIAHLQSQGLVRIERGRGAFAVATPLTYPLGPQTWFEQNLLGSNRTPSRTVLSVIKIAAPAAVAKCLRIRATADVWRITLLGEADGHPVNYGHHYFPAARLPDIGDAFRAFGDRPTSKLSFRKVLQSVGVSDFRRKKIRVRTQPAERDQARYLKMSPAEPVLVTEVTSVDPNGVPVVHAYTYFCSSRIEFVIEL